MRFKQSDFICEDGRYKLKKKEKLLQKACEEYLKLIGVPYFHLQHYYKLKCPKCLAIIEFITGGGEGLPDLIIFAPKGIFIPELKGDGGRLEKTQKEY